MPHIAAIWKRPECDENNIVTAIEPQPKNTRMNVPISSPRKFEKCSESQLAVSILLYQATLLRISGFCSDCRNIVLKGLGINNSLGQKSEL